MRRYDIELTKDALVRIHARIVPNGVVGGKRRATLLLTPVYDDAQTGGIPLSRWPRAVHDWLKGLNYEVPALVSPTPEKSSAVKLTGATVHRTAKLRAQSLPAIENRLDDICEMWRRSLWVPGAREDWTGLASRVSRSLRGETVRPSKLAAGDTDEAIETPPDAAVYGPDGELSPKTHLREAPATLTVDSALCVHHSDLALALESQRARALCSSLRLAFGEASTHTVPTFPDRKGVDLKDHAPGNLKKGQSEDVRFLINAIASQSPRQPQEALDRYVERLIKTADGPDLATARELFFQNVDVVAELRRKRKMAERAELHGDLAEERKAARKIYQDARKEMTTDAPAACAPPDWASACVTAADAAKGVDFAALTRSARYANWPQYKRPEEAAGTSALRQVDEDLEQAGRAFFTMQSTPSLSRAFLLAIDVTVEPVEPGGDPLPGVADYGRIAADLGALESDCLARNWTLFRNVPHGNGGAFWPATRGEADCAAQRSSTRQYGGLMVMGFGASEKPEDHAPRFDVTSLDIRTALELEIQRVSIKTADKEALDRLRDGKMRPLISPQAANADAVALQKIVRAHGAASDRRQCVDTPLTPGMNAPSPGEEGQEDEGDRQDVGLTLLDRGLVADAVRKLAVKQAKCGADAMCRPACAEGVVIDAEDLTTGFRLFVGTPGANAAADPAREDTDWRPLMARSITFGTSGPDRKLRDAIEPVLRALIGRAGSPARIALESASINVPGRMIPKQPGGAISLETEAVFEEAVSVWDGGPMGVDCSESPGAANTTGDALIFGRTLAVPTEGSDRPPRLRFGRPYRFALAAVYSGGLSVPKEEFPVADGSDRPAEDLYYPSDGMARAAATGAGGVIRPYVRALRQAKIGAPQTLVPQGHATRANGPMGPDTAGLMVVRSLDADPAASSDRKLASRAVPAVSQRIVVVPSVPQDRAVAHADWRANSDRRGLLDGSSHLRDGPPMGTFRNVRHRGPSATFPAIRTSHLKGLNGRQHFESRRVVDNPEAEAMAESDVQDGSVFAASGWHQSQYYPDPAAGHLAVRLSLRGQGGRIVMPSETELLSLADGVSYPERLPVVLSVRKREVRSSPAVEWSQIATSRKVTFDPSRRGDITRGGGFVGLELELSLAPHEWVDVEMWFVPEARQLARDFAIIQALAIQLSQQDTPSLACCAADVASGASDTLPDGFCEALSVALGESPVHKRAYFGPGGVVAPPMSTLLALAGQVRRAMVQSPLPEIAGVARLSAVHASNRAAEAPRLVGSAADHLAQASGPALCRKEPVRAWRPPETEADPADRKEAADCDEADAPVPSTEVCLCPDRADPLPVAAVGSTALVLSGEVMLDLNEIDTLEVRATMVLPGSTIFDDKHRGRSLAHRRANWWPQVGNPRGAAASDEGEFLPARDLFGFSVAPDGSTTLDEAEVTLLRAERLPRPSGESCTQSVSLRALFEEEIAGVRITERHRFPDGKARRMKVWVNGLARTSELMKTADRQLRSGDPWVRSDARNFQVGDLAPGESLRPEAQANFSEEEEVILPATIRPAKPDARAPTPSFRWMPENGPAVTHGKLKLERVSTIRIGLGREWFSSGEGERLGIVLWPPGLMTTDDRTIRENRARIALNDGTGGDRVIDLDGTQAPKFARNGDACKPSPTDSNYLPPFEDRHLGPGGKYVSRRGADPVREGVPHRQILLAPGDFADLKHPDGDIRQARLVQNVEMPLSDEASADNGGQDAEGEDRPPMLVSLLTYEPRFDVQNEEWYVELSLADSVAAETFVRLGLVRYQPNTRPGLRCSRPVRQQVKPLPRRAVEVWRRAQDDGWRVRMCGPTFTTRRVSDGLIDALNRGQTDGDRRDAGVEFTRCAAPAPDGLLTGPDAAPLMALTFRRVGTDAQQRIYDEIVPLPVRGMGKHSLLLRPADHEDAILDPAPEIRLTPGALLAATVLVKAGYTGNDQGIWVADILDCAVGDAEGLHLEVREVITDERDAPPTVSEVAAMPEQSVRSAETATCDAVPETPRANGPGSSTQGQKGNDNGADGNRTEPTSDQVYALVSSLDKKGPRFIGDFDLGLIANPKGRGIVERK